MRSKRTEMAPEQLAELRLAALLALLRLKDGEQRGELLGRLGHVLKLYARHEHLETETHRYNMLNAVDDILELRAELLSSIRHLTRHLDQVIDLGEAIETTYAELNEPF